MTLATTEDADGQDDTATVTHEVTGSDEYVYASFTANVRVLEDDVGKIDIQPADGITLGEGGDDVSYAVKLLQQPVTNVTVRVSVGTEVIIASTPKVSVDKSALTFTPRNWSTAQSVAVSPADDADSDDETLQLRHVASGDPGYEDVVRGLRVTVTDDEAAAAVIAPASLTVREGRGSAYRVRLSHVPSTT